MVRTAEQPIIADTSALVSLATKTDQNYLPAMKEAARLREVLRPIIVPSDVLVETVNILGKKSGHETALKAAGGILRPGSQFVLIETTAYLDAALEKFKVQSPAISLTDCIVMTVADHYDTKEIFGFDKQFQEAGCRRLEPSSEWKEVAWVKGAASRIGSVITPPTMDKQQGRGGLRHDHGEERLVTFRGKPALDALREQLPGEILNGAKDFGAFALATGFDLGLLAPLGPSVA
jgi:predicted nucleic acid-binding protein